MPSLSARKWVLAICVAAAILIVSVQSVSGAQPRRFFRRFVRPTPPRSYSSYDYQRQYSNYYYPKYYGGLHSSYFNSLGVAPGDVGLRGNGLYMTPW